MICTTRPAINDIRQCLQKARALVKCWRHNRKPERSLFRAFTSLAGDKLIGCLAYGIWRGRSQRFSTLRNCESLRYDAVARPRHTPTCLARGKCRQ